MLTQDCVVDTPGDGIDNDGDGFVDLSNGCSNTNGGDGGVFITNNITANPIVWTELPNNEPPSNQIVEVQVAVSGGTPSFFVQAGGGDRDTYGTLWRFDGTNPVNAWTQIDTNIPGGGGINVFAVDPNDPNRLYAGAAGPRIVFSTDGGTIWQNDPELDNLMTGGGVFRYQTQRGPTSFTGFRGYPQPSLLAFDPENGSVIVAGGRDSGVFLSANGGNRWGLLTDPFDSGSSGIPHLPRPFFAHFDHEPAGSVRLIVGTQGRGVWRIDVPTEADLEITTATHRDIPKRCVRNCAMRVFMAGSPARHWARAAWCNVCRTRPGWARRRSRAFISRQSSLDDMVFNSRRGRRAHQRHRDKGIPAEIDVKRALDRMIF